MICRDLIVKSARKLGLIRAGGTMSDADAADFLASLESQYAEWITQGAFGPIRPVIQTTDATAGLNQHLNNIGDTPLTVTLPTSVSDWWIDSIVPYDCSVVQVTSLQPDRQTYIYDGTVQRWMQIGTLTLEDEAPLSARGSDGLASILAVRLADEYGSDLLSPITLRQANAYKIALVTRPGLNEALPIYPNNDYGWPSNYQPSSANGTYFNFADYYEGLV